MSHHKKIKGDQIAMLQTQNLEIYNFMAKITTVYMAYIPAFTWEVKCPK